MKYFAGMNYTQARAVRNLNRTFVKQRVQGKSGLSELCRLHEVLGADTNAIIIAQMNAGWPLQSVMSLSRVLRSI